ncbi:MAG: tyrosine-type recombinase/integrase, partial [Planctomycetia bacterium]
DLAAIAEWRRERRPADAGPTTRNHRLAALKSFTRWMVRTGKAERDPTTTLSRRNAAVDRRHVRRALTTGELTKLLATAEAGPTIGPCDGPTRATVYALAALAGLRHGEIAKLKRTDFDLESRTLRVRATVAKNRAETYLPIHAGLSDRLATWFAAYHVALDAAAPFAWVGKVNTAELVRFDLAAAGIDYSADSGVVDFHALRVTFITSLHRAGVPLATAQKLARHSDPKLTSNIYGKMDLFDLAGAVSRLPDFAPRADLPRTPPIGRTGTDGGRESAVDRSPTHGNIANAASTKRLAATPAPILGAAMGAVPTGETCRNPTTVDESDHQTDDYEENSQVVGKKWDADDCGLLRKVRKNSGEEGRTPDLRVMNPPL